MSLVCWNCGTPLDDIPRPISRHAACSNCFNELHCCRLCRHYDDKRAMQCFEDRADPPLQKENANFCDFFSPTADAYQAQTTTKSNLAQNRLTDLFGNEETAARSATTDSQEQLENTNTPALDGDSPDRDREPTLTPDDQARRKLDDLFK